MRFALLRGHGLHNNAIFDRSSPGNRDDCFAPYAKLKERFLAADIQVDTVDVSQASEPIFELHQDVQVATRVAFNYLLMFETKFVKCENGKPAEWDRYRKIFTWDDDLVDGERFIKLNYPNPIDVHPVDGFSGRPRFCCLISGNKTLSVVDERDLYVERIKAIRWFERNAPQDFDLYGSDWDLPAWGRGRMGKVARHLLRKLSRVIEFHSFPSYRGRVEHKRDVLTRTRFAICYENVRNVPGYITEKIFDCFFSGCVPVYWGANNIADYVPTGCFIDRREFRDVGEVYSFLKTMTEQEFKGYQERIADFLRSDAAYPFGSEFFAETIVNTVIQDIGS